MVPVAVLLGTLLGFASALGPPPCGKHEVELFPTMNIHPETWPHFVRPIGKATGSYCATRCNATAPCPEMKGTNATCSMPQGYLPGHYCEYHCAEDIDCPSLGNIKGSCQLNIDSKICTYSGDIYASGGSGIITVTYSPDGKHILSGDEGDGYIWDVATGKSLRTFSDGEHFLGCRGGVAYSPDGKHVASMSHPHQNDCTGHINISDVATGELLHKLGGPKDYVSSLVYSPDGKHVASGGDEDTKIWDVATGQLLHKLKNWGADSFVTSLAYSPDGKLLATNSGGAYIWDVSTGKLLHTLCPNDQVNRVAYSPDGKHLATGIDFTKHIKIWDVATGKLQQKLGGHTSGVWCVAYSPDGKHLASGSEDATIKIWDVATGNLLHTLKTEHQLAINSVAYSPDGKHLASGGNDGTIRFFDVATGLTVLSHDIVV